MARNKQLIVLIPAALAAAILLIWAAIELTGGDGNGSAGPATGAGLEQDDAGQATAAPVSESEQLELAVNDPGARESAEDRNARTGETALDVQWISGTVRFPRGTPGDERVWVMALERPMKGREILDLGLPEAAADSGNSAKDPIVAVAQVDSEGRFRIALPEDASEAYFALAGRYQYSRASISLALPPSSEPVLTGSLGAWITGRLVPPPEASALESDFDGVDVALGPDLTGGFEAMGIQDESGNRKARATEQGRFEFLGVPTNLAHGISVHHDHLAALVHLGIAPVPGEHVDLELAVLRGATLRGRVSGESGAAIEDVLVEARRKGALGDALGALGSARSDAQGSFELLNVTPGTIELRASHEGYRAARSKLPAELLDGQVVDGLELVLDRGASIAGRVLFADGPPAAGADVRVAPDLSQITGMDGRSIARAGKATAQADAEGRFDVSGLTDVAYQVRASLEVEEGERAGEWFAMAKAVRPGSDPVVLELGALFALAGQVVDRDGQPIQSFRVRATLSGSGAMFGIGAEKRSWGFEEEPEGRFQCTGLQAGAWELLVTSEGYAQSDTLDVELPRAVGAEALVIALEPSASIAGVVHDTAGRPIAGARVRQEMGLGQRMQLQQSGGVPSTYSQVEGRFLLEELDPGPVQLVASSEGFAASEPVSCEAVAGQLFEDVVLRLRAGGTLTGEVYASDGEPDAGRMVMAQAMPSFNANHMLQTDAQGTFRIEHLEPGSWQVVAMANFMSEGLGDDGDASMADFLGEMKVEMAEIVEGEETHVVLGATPADPVSVRGRVVHAGEGVGGTLISFLPEGAGGMGALKLETTDANGAFEVELDHPGPYMISVQSGMAMGQQNTIEYLEQIPSGVREHTLTIELPAGRISGEVRGPEGAPLAGCRITLNVEGGISVGSTYGGHYTELVTDESGRYEVRYLRPGLYSLAAGGASFGGLFGGENQIEGARAIRSGLRLSQGQWLDSVDFRLERPGRIVGSVLDSGGAPVSGAAVFVRDDEGRLLDRFSLVTTGAGGSFTYTGLAAGRYSVRAQTGAKVSGAVRVEVTAGGEARAVVTLDAGTHLIVQAADAEGGSLRATISVVDERGEEYGGMLSMASLTERMGAGFTSGEQRVGPLPPGKYTVTATSADGRSASKPVTLKGQAERRVNLRL
jgi:protocatechuate 3,4-dioxygenase beta subunit